MSLKMFDDYQNLNGFTGESFELDDIRRLSLYATIRADDLKELQYFGENLLNKKIVIQKEKTRFSLQDLFTKPKFLQCVTDEIIVEEQTVNESLDSQEEVRTINDPLGVQYTVNGIRKHEFPVIGFHVDDRICPGFKYHVRYLGSNRQVFHGEPRLLESIGMGYGKRLTFKGDNPNIQDCVFWSDSNPEGYGFSISVINKGEKYMIYDSLNQRIGDIVIESVQEPQVEEAMTCCKGDVTKMVRVQFTCSIQYHNRLDHSLYHIVNKDLQTVNGIAVVTRDRKSREAKVVCIKDIKFLNMETCTLWNES